MHNINSSIKITYLLGAGASCGIRDDSSSVPNYAMPLVKEIPQRLELMSYILDTFKNFYVKEKKIRLTNSQDESLDDLMIKLFTFNENIKSHASIDTYAKKVFFTDVPEMYEEVKSLIDLYFIFEQCLFNQDIRYDLFVASILEGLQGDVNNMPKSINVISWNYDFQFELSLANFFNCQNLKTIRNKFLTVPGRETIIDEDELDGFKLIHLNGVSGGYYNGKDRNKIDFRSDDIKSFKLLGNNLNLKEIIEAIGTTKKKLQEPTNETIRRLFSKLLIGLVPSLIQILDKYSLYSNHDITSPIRFAWEGPKHKPIDEDDILPLYIDGILKKTDILVIIGYSFPTFNREIDKKILKLLQESATIYLQVPRKDYNGIMTKIEYLSFGKFKDSVKPLDVTNEFFIPYEFS